MNKNFDQILRLYDYEFPEEAIAQEPAAPRDSAKLLIYDRGTGSVRFDTFRHMGQYLPKNAVLVLNETKVLPARLRLIKPTGGTVRTLYVGIDGPHITVMANRRLALGDVLTLTPSIHFTVAGHRDNYHLLTPSFPQNELFSVLEEHGQTPIPPYIKHSPLSEADLKSQYQTVFAKHRGSVAAPTASLHFTRELLDSLLRAGTETAFVTLHVNLGTFAPLTQEQMTSGALHSEWYEIPPETAAFLNQAKAGGRPIIAVGTTVVRTLESAAAGGNTLTRLSGTTDLFLTESSPIHFVDGLITNFHVPRSSLLMLVSAFTGREQLLDLYRQAIARKFRLFSFGDGMLIL